MLHSSSRSEKRLLTIAGISKLRWLEVTALYQGLLVLDKEDKFDLILQTKLCPVVSIIYMK